MDTWQLEFLKMSSFISNLNKLKHENNIDIYSKWLYYKAKIGIKYDNRRKNNFIVREDI